MALHFTSHFCIIIFDWHSPLIKETHTKCSGDFFVLVFFTFDIAYNILHYIFFPLQLTLQIVGYIERIETLQLNLYIDMCDKIHIRYILKWLA